MITEHGRTCADCKEFKFWHEFYKDPSSKLDHQTRCKDCAKERQKTNYYKKVNAAKKPTVNKFLTGVLKMKCLHCESEFKQRFGREECCSKSCAAYVREEKRRAAKRKKITPSDFLRGAISLGT